MTVPLLWATSELPGTGGVIGPDPEDFQVQEVPLYPPGDQGTHCFVWLRKRGITTDEAVKRLARALGCRPADVGVAGLKDRRAVTEQWVSVPDASPERVQQVVDPALEILGARLHPHKLRTGHLRGNRFVVRLVGVCRDGLARTQETLGRLAERGMYHYFGPQRFGRGGENVDTGLALLRGEKVPGGRRRRRLLVSAVQSALFNDYLGRRVAEQSLDQPLCGEVLQRIDSGGPFCCTDPLTDAARIAAREVVPTGPLFGPRMKQPLPGSRPEALEQGVLEDLRLDQAVFQAWSRLAPGGRRPLVIWPEDLDVTIGAPGELLLSFFLPAGAYATVLLGEVTKTPLNELRS